MSTPSRRLSNTTTRPAPPNRRKACSCNSAQTRALERHTNRRTDLRLLPKVITNSRARRYLPLCGSRTMGPTAVIDLGFFPRCGEDHGPRLWWLIAVQLVDETLHVLIAAAQATIGNQVLPDRHGIATPAESQLDCLPVGLTGAGSGTAASNRRPGPPEAEKPTPRASRQSPPWTRLPR